MTKVGGMKEICIKRDMNKEERSKLKEFRVEAQSEKQGKNTVTSEEIHLESCGHESEEMGG